MKLRALAGLTLLVLCISVLGTFGTVTPAYAEDPEEGGGAPEPPGVIDGGTLPSGPDDASTPEEVAEWLASTFVGSTIL
jgi:hypothetical protein